MSQKRVLQMGRVIQEHIATMIVHGQVSDQRVQSVTITSVKVSPDLQIAKVYFSILGDVQKRKLAEQGLKQAASFIRRELGRVLQIRYTPELHFYFDESIEYAAKMSELIAKANSESTLSSQDAEPLQAASNKVEE